MSQKIRRLFPLLFILCAISFLADIRTAGAGEPHSFLWQVKSNTSTLYVLGSVHMLKQENYPLNPAIEKAFDQSAILVVEANISDSRKLDPGKLLQNALYPENDSLQKHLSPETYDYIRKETSTIGLPAELINKQKPWFLALTLEALQLVRLGFDPRYGVDTHFLAKAKGKKILELESPQEQIDLLSTFTESEQELFLLYTVKELNTLGEQTDSLVKAWSAGDVKGMESVLTESIRRDPRLEPIYKRLLEDRNKKMTSKIEAYLSTGETYFVVVGAGHLVGNKGIIQMLKDKGYRIEQH